MFWLRRFKNEDEGGSWLLAYGDLMSLLLAVFVMVAAMSELRGGSRFRMVRDAIAEHDALDVSRIEIDRDGPSYTIDTIRALKDDYPEGVCFIVGADRLLDITTWREPEALLRSVPFVIAPREGVSGTQFQRAPFDTACVIPLEMEEVDLSSSWLRERVARGEGISDWVPPVVAQYISENGLYRSRARSGVRST